MNLGSGRVVPQGVMVIDAEIASGDVRPQNATLRACIAHVRRSGGTLHLMGLLSDGKRAQLDRASLRADRRRRRGRRAARGPRVSRRARHAAALGAAYLERLEAKLAAARPHRRDRERLRAASTRWTATGAGSARAGVRRARRRARRAPRRDARRRACARRTRAARTTSSSCRRSSASRARSRDGDACIFFNFRPGPRAPADDRLQRRPELFDDELRRSAKRYADLFFATMTKYEENYTNPVLFGPRPQYDTFGEIVARDGLRQLRLAETEKYAHVTYFFNGGREDVFAGRRPRAHSVGSLASRPTTSRRRCARARSPSAAVEGVAQRALRRDRDELRQRRHGRPHRQVGADDRGASR